MHAAAEKTTLVSLCLGDRTEEESMNLVENIISGGDRPGAIYTNRHARRPRIRREELAEREAGQMLKD